VHPKRVPAKSNQNSLPKRTKRKSCKKKKRWRKKGRQLPPRLAYIFNVVFRATAAAGAAAQAKVVACGWGRTKDRDPGCPVSGKCFNFPACQART